MSMFEMPRGSHSVRWSILVASTLFVIGTSVVYSAPPKSKTETTKPSSVENPAKDAEKTAYDYYLPGPDGKSIPLSNYKGKYLLIVNLARNSSYNSQLAALSKDADTYKDKGLVVIGVPSNDFGAGEPGTNAEIQKAYADAKVTFSVMAVSKLGGDDGLPFYQYLTKSKGVPPGGPVHWNYTKFILDKNGKVVARLSPDVDAGSPEMLATLTEVTTGTFKPKKDHGKGGPGGDDDGDDDDE